MKNKKLKVCVICKDNIQIDAITKWSSGNNAEPISSGRCCNTCNYTIVVPQRMRNIVMSLKGVKT